MGAFFGSVLIGGGLVFFIIALIAVFRPLPKFKLATRKTAVAGLALSVVSCVGGATLMPTDQEIAKAESAKKADEAAKAAADKAEAKAANAALQEAIVAQWRSVLDTVEPCDKAYDRVADVVSRMSDGTGSVYDAYARADEGVETCRVTHSALRDLDVPGGAEGRLKDDIDKALEACGNAYLVRQMALESAKTIFNGDMRPSVVNEFKNQAETAQAGVFACVASYTAAALEAGVDLKKLGLDSESGKGG